MREADREGDFTGPIVGGQGQETEEDDPGHPGIEEAGREDIEDQCFFGSLIFISNCYKQKLPSVCDQIFCAFFKFK